MICGQRAEAAFVAESLKDSMEKKPTGRELEMTERQPTNSNITIFLLLLTFVACGEQGGDSRSESQEVANAAQDESTEAGVPEQSEQVGSSAEEYERQALEEEDLRSLIPGRDQGSYEAVLEDGTTFRVTLVDVNGELRVKELGHKFYPTGLEIERIVAKSGTPFGRTTDTALKFQFPVMLKWSPSTSLVSESGGSVDIAWFKSIVTWNTSGEVLCTLIRIDTAASDYESDMSLYDITFGPAPEGAEMKPLYKFKLGTESGK